MTAMRTTAWLTVFALLFGCSDDGTHTTDGPSVDLRLDGGPPPDDGPTPWEGGPFEGGPPEGGLPDKGPDGPVVPKLPPPPAGAVTLRISVDDTTDKAYAAGELLLKGSFAFDPKTFIVSPNSNWPGPYVPLHDDGPNGFEGPGSTAGDHRFGAVVYIVPSSPVTLEYGLVSPAGWMWPHGSSNNKVTVSAGEKLKDLSSYKIPPRAGADAIWRVDSTKLANRSVKPGYQMVVIRATATHWSPLPCNDQGEDGDAAKGDNVYTCRLSAHLGKGELFPHLGLPQPGTKVRFYVDIGGASYKDPAGVSVKLGTATTAVTKSGSELVFDVPGGASTINAPAPDNAPLPSGRRGDLPGGQFSLPAGGIKGHYYLPGSYDAHRSTPLLVALHGAFEQGQWMIDVWKNLAEDRGFILLAPSSSAKSWDLTAVFAGQVPKEDQPIRDAINWIESRHTVDVTRVGVEGFSDGASMALYMGLTHGKLFNVAMGNSPGGMGKNYPKPDKPAIYITHGDADSVLPVSNARWIKNTLLSAGYKVVYFEFPGVGHVFPTEHKIPMLRFLEQN